MVMKKGKLVDKLLKIPSDFTWDELVSVLNFLGYTEIATGRTSGSRRRFADVNNNLILLHKPHPSNIVKKYVLRQVLQNLKERGQIKDE
jgi:hypothetical protein